MASCKQAVSGLKAHPPAPGDLTAWAQGHLRESTAADFESFCEGNHKKPQQTLYLLPLGAAFSWSVALSLCLSYVAAELQLCPYLTMCPIDQDS